MVSKEQKIKEIKEFIKDNPTLNSNQTLKEVQLKGLGIRKQEFQELFRETKKIPEPTLVKREASIPIKFKTTKIKTEIKIKAKERTKLRIEPKPTPKKERIPFEKTKFGKMTKTTQTTFSISEKKAIIIVRKLLKIPKKDFGNLNKKSKFILTEHGY